MIFFSELKLEMTIGAKLAPLPVCSIGLLKMRRTPGPLPSLKGTSRKRNKMNYVMYFQLMVIGNHGVNGLRVFYHALEEGRDLEYVSYQKMEAKTVKERLVKKKSAINCASVCSVL